MAGYKRVPNLEEQGRDPVVVSCVYLGLHGLQQPHTRWRLSAGTPRVPKGWAGLTHGEPLDPRVAILNSAVKLVHMQSKYPRRSP